MNKPGKSRIVREPIQVYIVPDERRLLDQLAKQTGLSRAEILRQGLRRFAAEQAGSDGPMQAFMRAMRERDLPAEIAADHDEFLARAYSDDHDR